MAKTEMQMQRAAMKDKNRRDTEKVAHAVFGHCAMADGGVVCPHGMGANCKTCGYADGGMVQAVKGMAGKRDAAIEAAVHSSAPAPAAPAEPASPASVRVVPGLADQLAAKHAADMAAEKARLATPAPQPSLLQRAKAVFGMAGGGAVRGPGTSTSDSIPARLSHGEYVLPADTVRAVGVGKLDALKDATHTPVAKRFGETGNANGGEINYSDYQLPDESTEATRLRNNPALRDPYVRAQVAKAGTIGSAPAAEPVVADAAAPASRLGQAANAENAATAAPGMVRRAASGLARLGAPAAVASGAVKSALAGPEERDAFTNSITPYGVTPGPVMSAVGDTVRTLRNIGDAATFGLATRTGEGLAAGADAVQRGAPAVAAAAQAFADTAGARTAPKAPSTPSGEPSTPDQAAAAPAVDPDAAAGITPDQRAFFGRAGVDGSYKNVGDFGSDGTTVFRKGNSFVGAGGGTNKATGYQPAGVDFGIPRMAASGTLGGLSGDYPQQPQYQSSPQAAAIHDKISQLSTQLAAIKPGQFAGKKHIIAQINALTTAAGALEQEPGRVNAFNAQNYGQRVAQFGHAIGYRSQLATNELGRRVADQNFQIKRAEIGNTAHQQLFTEAQARLGASKDRLTALAKADGKDPELYQVVGATRMFPDSNGKQSLYQDLDPAARAKADGFIQNQASKMQANKEAGLPYSLGDADKNESPGFAGWVHSVVNHPVDTIRFGATQTGGWRTGRPNIYASHEQSAADAAQQKARQ